MTDRPASGGAAEPLTLSRPAQAVIVLPDDSLEWAIDGERTRRQNLKAGGHPYHYWHERGDDEPPGQEWWCERCVGFYGVPHDGFVHEAKALCRNLGWYPGNRQCACLECIVHEAWSYARRVSAAGAEGAPEGPRKDTP